MNNHIYREIKKVKESTSILLGLNAAQREEILKDISRLILENQTLILEANAYDVSEVKKMDIHSSMLERLSLTPAKIQNMAQSVEAIALLKDPLGHVLDGFNAPSGIRVEKVTVPLGVVAIIYESRPNVTSDTAALCLKSGNGIVLKGGKETIRSNRAIVKIFHDVLERHCLPASLVYMAETREEMDAILSMNDIIDVVIPRGGTELVQYVSKHSQIPVIKHDKGVCHLYVHSDADFSQAVNIAINAKTQRPSVCNAIETLLVDSLIFEEFLSFLKPSLEDKGTIIYACDRAINIFKAHLAHDENYYTEYGDNILNVRVVENIDEAIEHINSFGSHHSDAIVTDNYKMAEYFLDKVDSACVYVNASTRFSDGGEFGFGAEMGIATGKLHVRGPMGLNELTTYKFKIRGQGQIRM